MIQIHKFSDTAKNTKLDNNTISKPSTLKNKQHQSSCKKHTYQYKLIDVFTYANTQEIEYKLSKFEHIKNINLKKTDVELQYKERATLTCNITFYITNQEKQILDNTWSVQLYDQC